MILKNIFIYILFEIIFGFNKQKFNEYFLIGLSLNYLIYKSKYNI